MMRDKKDYQDHDIFQQGQYVPQQQSLNDSNHNEYATALHQLPRPHRPSRTERLFGIANELKAGLHNSQTMESGQHKEQVVNVGTTLDNVRKQVLNTDYKQQRRDYRSKERSLKKLAKLEEKRLKELRKQEKKAMKEIRPHEVVRGSGSSVTTPPPSHISANSSHQSQQQIHLPYISPAASSSESRCQNQSHTSTNHHNYEYNEPPPPYHD